MAELSRAASCIGEVIKLIKTVAEQTNLLALNETIEPAPRGRKQEGSLPSQSPLKPPRQTAEIGLHIAGIQAATQDAVATIKEIGITIGGISEIASTVAAAVEEKGAVTQEIVRSVQDAVRGTAEVDRNVGKTTSASSQVLASTQAIAKESKGKYHPKSTILKDDVQRFLAAVRVA